MQSNTDEDGWTKVSYKNKLTKKKFKSTFDSNKKTKNINKDFDKTKVKLWYDSSSWQHNILINNYEYEDGTTVLSKLNISNLYDEYSKAESNYDKNNIIRKLTKVINDEKWKEEEGNIRMINKNLELTELAEPKQENENQKDEAIETDDTILDSNKVNVVKSTRKYDNSISFAEMTKRS